MEKKASITALMAAFARAYHNENSKKPVFADTAVRRLLSDEEYRQISAYIIGGVDFFAPGQKDKFEGPQAILEWVVNSQLAPTPLGRARFCEDSLKTAVLTGATQYVILGAGLDTFAWREPKLMEELTVFEVDHPLTQEDKRLRLARSGLEIPENLRFVPVDFRSDDLHRQLRQAGFDEKKKTFFSWLGVSYYLSEEDIGRLLESISSFAAEGSSLLFDYGDEGLFTAEEKRVQNMLAMAAAGGEPMQFCADPEKLTALLDQHHFLIYELLTTEEIQQSYFAERQDGLSAFEHISYGLAVLKGTPFINTKEKILQTALRLFAENGYEAVSTKDIADRLSITKGALYRHYTNKRDIFHSILARMEQEDRRRAEACQMPVETAAKAPESYRQASTKTLESYTLAQFRYWTGEEFPSAFRRMLTLEQHRSREMAALYQQYFVRGPLEYTADLLERMPAANSGTAPQKGVLQTAGGGPAPQGGIFPLTGGQPLTSEQAKLLALEYYGPIFMLYSLYDGAEYKQEVQNLLEQHVRSFLRA